MNALNKARVARPYDAAEPPEGVRLELGTLAALFRVSLNDMAEAAGLSKTVMFRIAAENRWPARQQVAPIRAAIAALLQERGATPEQVASAWRAHVRRSGAAVSAAELPLINATNTPNPTDPQTKETDVLLPKQSLSMDARKAFKLFTNPFDADVQSDADMFQNAEIAFVREACWQAASGGRFVALVSESGGGKTTIVQDLEARIARDRKQIIVIRPSVLGMEDSASKGHQLKSTDILSAVITTLDPLASVPQTLEARTKRAARLLTGSMEAGFQHLLVIEEAHCLPDATLKHCKRLHELHLGRKALLGILLVAQPELMMKLDPKRASLREVTQRCEVVQLMPLDGDLKAYLAHRAGLVQRRLEEFITDDGVEAIRSRLTVERHNGGARRTTSLLYPLAVNNWVIAALNEAASVGAPVVNRDVVRSV